MWEFSGAGLLAAIVVAGPIASPALAHRRAIELERRPEHAIDVAQRGSTARTMTIS